ncbi:hypothetical protein WH47_03532 [Habropoda laboriosa]|uniref:Uncharacterized protein n=1 Tax=Habropoda laboriosa TaxID=597456 RepID=A0A0L7RC13_9HYME|nr:PREDICTED: uncharacterized protein LOC108580082 [Habropoda laboriosa]XP_017799231.1 PREDICTED: uncharacterized protein LOC108580082 [Habropoda laboriosa]KOC68374.1 hypothetical protein WH47_03532 [Habropoda laboriosa]
MKSKKHIDDAQPATVDEHFQLILDDRTTIDPDFVKVTPDDLPEWFDKRLFKTGQEYYKDNLLGFGTAHIAGLVAILAVPDILEVLVYTKKSSTVCLSYKRFAETLLLMYALFHSDMLDPNSKWFKAMNVVRWRHATVSKRHQKDGHHGIYQKDMVITQFGFIGYVFICPEKVGLAHTTYEQKMGFNHFWRVTGHLLGITDRINICRETVEETTELCKRVAYEILAKHLENPLPEFEKLSSNAVTGMWYIDVTIDTDAFMYKTYDLTGVKYKKPLGWYSTLMLYRGMFLLYMCSVPYIGKVVREIFNVILTLTYLMLEYCPVAAWLAFGKQKSQLCLYPNI